MVNAQRVVARARKATAEVLPDVIDAIGLGIKIPEVHGSYNKSYGGYCVMARALPYGECGTVKVNVEVWWSTGGLRAIMAHELSHIALYQYNPELCREQEEKDLWEDADAQRFQKLNEGIATYVEHRVLLARAKRGEPLSLLRALRHDYAHTNGKTHPLYCDGYRYVRHLRRAGVTVRQLLVEPLRFLPDR